MVKSMIVSILAMCCACLASNAQAQQQSPQSMQQQETAANAQSSTSGTATYTTPYTLFQAYYAGMTGTSTAAMYACFTPTALNAAFEGTPPTTPSDFAAMDTANATRSATNYSLQSFTFKADPNSPQITAIITFSVNDPQNPGHQMTLAETDVLTLIDTGMGWMINGYVAH